MSEDGNLHRALNPTIHAPVRLNLMAALAGVDNADFPTLQDTLELTDYTLSKQLAILEAAGYIEVTKGKHGRRPRTWAALTPEGRAALTHHLETLTAIAALSTTHRKQEPATQTQ